MFGGAEYGLCPPPPSFFFPFLAFAVFKFAAEDKGCLDFGEKRRGILFPLFLFFLFWMLAYPTIPTIP